nr:hypothetical protein [Halomonas heilongjiangensis]
MRAGIIVDSTSGSVQLTDSAAASYRVIYALWGNVSEWTDGLRHTDELIERCGYDGMWGSTGINRPNTSLVYMDTVRADAAIADLLVASTWQGSEAGATVPDFHLWNGSGERVDHCGGVCSNGSDAGLWYLNLDGAATTTDSLVRSRLARVI